MPAIQSIMHIEQYFTNYDTKDSCLCHSCTENDNPHTITFHIQFLDSDNSIIEEKFLKAYKIDKNYISDVIDLRAEELDDFITWFNDQDYIVNSSDDADFKMFKKVADFWHNIKDQDDNI